MKLDDFRPQRRNANKHTEYGMQMLEKSMGEVGFIGAMTAANDGEIFDGSARIEKSATIFDGVEPIVIETDGPRPVIVKRTDIESADDPRAVRAGILANRVFEVDLDWDVEVLAELAEDEMLDGLFSEADMSIMLNGFIENTSTDREKQGVSSTWGQVDSTENLKIIIGDIESRISLDDYEVFRNIIQKSYDSGMSIHVKIVELLTNEC